MANSSRVAFIALVPLFALACSAAPEVAPTDPEGSSGSSSGASEEVGRTEDGLTKLDIVFDRLPRWIFACGPGTVSTTAVTWDGAAQLWDKTGVLVAEVGGTDVEPAPDGSKVHDLVGVRLADKAIVGRARVTDGAMPCFLNRHAEKFRNLAPLVMNLATQFEIEKTVPPPKSCGTLSLKIPSFSFPGTCVSQDFLDTAVSGADNECIAFTPLPNACWTRFPIERRIPGF